jgi:hypothetical protein
MAPLRVDSRHEKNVFFSCVQEHMPATISLLVPAIAAHRCNGADISWITGTRDEALDKDDAQRTLRYNLHYGRVVKLAATADSKSAEGNLMSVRLRPRPPSTAPLKINAKIRQDGSIRLKPSFVENGQKFTHSLLHSF